jgi:hypothetical protein
VPPTSPAVPGRRMEDARDLLIEELRDERAAQGGGFDGELYFSCEHEGCPARTFDIRVIERGSLRLKMLPKCSFCNRELRYVGLHSK